MKNETWNLKKAFSYFTTLEVSIVYTFWPFNEKYWPQDVMIQKQI